VDKAIVTYSCLCVVVLDILK